MADAAPDAPDTPLPPSPGEPDADAASTSEDGSASDSAAGEHGSEDVAVLRREAAGYRRQLRDVEAERDALREQVDRRDRADAERLASERLEAGADLWASGVELEQLRGEDGVLSGELVDRAVERALEARPHWRKRSGGFDGGARVTPEPAPSFGEALKDRRLRA